jgi:hypothetical protein
VGRRTGTYIAIIIIALAAHFCPFPESCVLIPPGLWLCQQELTMTENAQPAILAHSLAVFRVLQVVSSTAFDPKLMFGFRC